MNLGLKKLHKYITFVVCNYIISSNIPYVSCIFFKYVTFVNILSQLKKSTCSSAVTPKAAWEAAIECRNNHVPITTNLQDWRFQRSPVILQGAPPPHYSESPSS